MNDEELWLETDYFENFRCKGGSCRNSCCEGWQIAVTMKEYFDLIGRECSPELHHRLECAFRTPDEPSPERFRLISPNWLGKCPLHGDDGLCMLHKECGEGALPEICRVYPRSLKRENGLNQACCSGSCEAVIEMLMEEEQLVFQFARLHMQPELNENGGTDILKLGPVCMHMLQNREYSLPERIARICSRISGRDFAIDENKRSAALQGIIRMIRETGDDSASMHRFGAAALERYSGGNADDYRADAEIFARRFPKWQRWYENILANHMLYADFPCTDSRVDASDAANGLCLVYGLMRMIGISHSRESGKRDDLADALAGIFRLIEHSPFYYNAKLLLKDPEMLLTL